MRHVCKAGVNYSSEATGDKPTVNKRVAERGE